MSADKIAHETVSDSSNLNQADQLNDADGLQTKSSEKLTQLALQDWLSACVTGERATDFSGCLVDTDSPAFVRLDKSLSGASSYLNVIRGVSHGGFIKIFGPEANPAGNSSALTLLTTSPARCMLYQITGGYGQTVTDGRAVGYNAALSAPINVPFGVSTPIKVSVNNTSTLTYGMNDGLVLLCLGVTSLDSSTGAPLDGTDASWL